MTTLGSSLALAARVRLLLSLGGAVDPDPYSET